ncbi:protein transport protein Sec24D isoform X1 [Rhopalosiphum padi]|uniref:protein transport protein Sec24D isoform X1 n=1 Tax=Rhopalosiphum padi TaxID=40932 RepID=UPI00298E6D18|nr:protein transport protein Sec24D isoform X1 [Rhopalosiphum padi]XP_060840275.1 protein transport protein Sec24D isoform X1 [Rhopalosiphum padi]XP_060840276.1 protein transport protein Sec24D isoform X1 [Rhopalosiphum padi]
MNNSQFAQERPTQNYGAPPTSQQNGQHNTPSSNVPSYNQTEGQLNDQFSQLGFNNRPSLPPVQNNTLPSNISNFSNGPQVNTSQSYSPADFNIELTGPPKQFSSSVPFGGSSNQNSSDNFQDKTNNLIPQSAFPGNSIQSNIHDGIINQESKDFNNGTPNNLSEAMYGESNEFSTNTSNLVSNQIGSGLSSSQPIQSAFSVVSPQSRSQRSYPSNVQQPQLVENVPSQSDLSTQKLEYQSNYPPQQSKASLQQPDFPPPSNLISQSDFTRQPNSSPQQRGFPPQPNSILQQPGFPPQPNSTPQQPGFPPQPNSTSQQPGFPPQPNSTLQQPGFPPQPNSISQQSSFPPQPNSTQQRGFPPQPNSTSQQPGFPPQPNSTLQQPGFPPQPNSISQKPGFPPQPSSTLHQSGFPPQQPGFPPQPNSTLKQPGFPPLPNSISQQSGFPPQPNSTLQQPGFPPQPNSTPQQPGFPPQPNSTLQQPGFPPQPNSTPRQPGFPPEPNSTPQQPGFPPQPNSTLQQPGFPPQPNSTLQQPGFPPQPSSTPRQPGFPPQPNSISQQPGFPPQPNLTLQQPGFPPQPNSTLQQPGFPPQPNSILQQPGFPPQPNSTPQQPGFPPQPNSTLQQPGFPPQPNSTLQQPGFPPPPNSTLQKPGFQQQPNLIPQQSGFSPQQQQGFPLQPGSLPSQQMGFPSQTGNLPPRQAGYPPQQPGLTSQSAQQPGYSQQHNGFHPQQPNYPPQQSGYPPQQPGYPPQQPGFNQGTPAYMGQPAPSRRLDPDQMPSPVQVIQDDQQSKSGLFLTNQRGLVPPLVTTDFTVQDSGNASPRLIRSTMYCVPTTTDIMKQTSVPFGLVISPLAKIKPDEYPLPIINTGEIGPVRCKRCKAYMSPFMQFIDGGKHFTCLLCKATTEVPVEYFQHLDHTGQRLDRSERPELCFGSYEFIVPKEYCRKEIQPKPPAYIFVIDVSYNNIKSGLVRLICAFMKELLTQLPTELGNEKSKIRVGFITYDTTVHFYNIKETLAVPQMMIVGDTSEVFMPLLDGFLCDPEQSSQVIDVLMEQIPTQFNETRTTETILLPAIKAGMEALKNADCCGKLFVFHSSLPIAEAPGKLKNREDRKLLATDKEKTILNPQTNVYKELGEECVQVGCSVDLFITNNSFIDLPTIGQISKISGGEIFKYTYFQAEVDGQRFLSDLKHDISRPTVFDAVMRVRTSTGTRPTDFYGHFFMSNSTDVELAAIDCDKAIAIEVKHDDKLDEQDGVLVQTAMLYTSCSGQRRVRILNLSLRSSGQMGELYRSCDLDTIMNFFGKQVMYKILESSGRQVKDAITNKTAQILATYRKHCASPSSAGQLILPECMKLMPLYVNCLIKCDAMSGGPDLTVDDRWFNMHLVITADIPTTLGYFYPRLIPIHTLADEKLLDDVSIPDQLRCSFEKLAENGAYILENGVYMFLWLGMGLSQTFLSDVFGVQNITYVDTEHSAIPVLDNPLNKAVRQVLSKIQKERSHTMRLSIIRQKDKIETVMRHFLVEDHGIDNSSSYVEFLCHMHKEIRNLLS